MADVIKNTTFGELKVGDTASIERVCSVQDLYLFAHVSGNTNPVVVPDQASSENRAVTAPFMWAGSLISAVLGNLLPGPGTLYRSQDLRAVSRVKVGDKVRASVRCVEKKESPIAVFETRIERLDGTVVAEGRALVDVPLERITVAARELPTLILDEGDQFTPLIDRAKTLPPMATAVVCPDDHNSLGGAVLAAREGLIEPILIGSRAAIFKAAEAGGLDISSYKLIDAATGVEASAKAVELVRRGEAASVMKGNLHTDELLGQVVKKDGGLRSGRRISHVFVMDAPTLDHLLFISDAAINIAPDLVTKVDITQNAIDIAIACGLEKPRVGILSAVETVNPNIPSTLDAAALSKMAERGQIKGGIVDGPLAMDNAMDVAAARTKGITSLVAGRADVLIVPNLEAGNMIVKELTFVARAEAAGLVVGAAAPVMLTSRADNDRARLVSAALAQLYEYRRRTGRAVPAPGGETTKVAAE
ncbi:bifunctional enoyl-CoA hydratase/phosphate acetyltransferase [Rhodoplanes sp. TEM]|uniref:Bifunctional enoyl-CoA hydratase/phosphate acetyltransferase n=1 Tax=Rhodoplanes tepidamans TaxID=200616 RepID=A0ABT5JHQ9_RHOTP|nr:MULTISPECIES: bifunctional enoyl-CoA hydratase/phosphate acetyltransferase [Rhodoplanes]MDC7789137.1 bifunctional enoyl-CoA hydratase/phosphate acetyltransferase [Rhodoplanes tepidamans]MDC7982754.1 bifunctional enoyl-CoA hydratase/phosphate acetyltransferase [Rhodoplanes sp. TEM]MDQ0357417.1 phosphate butyryltransferase [Rhodoplanes tepidamans]